MRVQPSPASKNNPWRTMTLRFAENQCPINRFTLWFYDDELESGYQNYNCKWAVKMAQATLIGFVVFCILHPLLKLDESAEVLLRIIVVDFTFVALLLAVLWRSHQPSAYTTRRLITNLSSFVFVNGVFIVVSTTNAVPDNLLDALAELTILCPATCIELYSMANATNFSSTVQQFVITQEESTRYHFIFFFTFFPLFGLIVSSSQLKLTTFSAMVLVNTAVYLYNVYQFSVALCEEVEQLDGWESSEYSPQTTMYLYPLYTAPFLCFAAWIMKKGQRTQFWISSLLTADINSKEASLRDRSLKLMRLDESIETQKNEISKMKEELQVANEVVESVMIEGGTVLSRFEISYSSLDFGEIKTKIGEGSFGTVFKATLRQRGNKATEVAVKTLRVTKITKGELLK